MQFDLTSAIQIHIPKKIEILRPDSKTTTQQKRVYRTIVLTREIIDLQQRTITKMD